MSIMSVNMAMSPNRILHIMEERKNESEVLVYHIYKHTQSPQRWFDNCQQPRTKSTPSLYWLGFFVLWMWGLHLYPPVFSRPKSKPQIQAAIFIHSSREEAYYREEMIKFATAKIDRR